MELEWVDAPPPKDLRGGKAQYADALPVLRENPGRWAVVASYKPGSSGYTAAKRLRSLGFDAEARGVDGVNAVYARWPEDTPAEPTPIRKPA